MQKTMKMNLRKNQKGFTLIELGIVVAVIAILASAVLVGQGFIESSRTAKATQGVHTLKKAVINYAGLKGGKLSADATGLTQLANRNLIQVDAAGNLQLAGTKVEVSKVELMPGTTTPEQMVITIELQSATMSDDIHSILAQDPHYYTGGDDCDPSFADDKTIVCFKDLV